MATILWLVSPNGDDAQAQTPLPKLLNQNCETANQLFRESENRLDKESVLRRVLELCPEHGQAANNLALVYENRGALKQAELLYERAIATGNAGAAPYAGLADVLTAQAKLVQAESAYQQFLRRLAGKLQRGDPNNFGVYQEEYLKRLNTVRRKLGKQPLTTNDLEPIVDTSYITRSLLTRPKRVRGIAVEFRDKPYIDIPIHFDFDSINILPGSEAQLQEVAKSLRNPALKETQIVIEGHTDSVGTDSYNIQLSLRRAQAVRRMLAEVFKIAPSRLSVRGYGEGQPVSSNDTESGRAANRRVTFVNRTTP